MSTILNNTPETQKIDLKSGSRETRINGMNFRVAIFSIYGSKKNK